MIIAGLAGLSYAWGISRDGLEPFYAAAVRSMGTDWHNFFFGAFDPAGTVTVDKLFSDVFTFHPYYTAGLSPPIAAILGAGIASLWESRTEVRAVQARARSSSITGWRLPLWTG